MNPIDRIASRLPKGDEVSLPDVAIAFDVSNHTVEAWRESGEFHGFCMNKGTGTKPRWWIMRDAVIAFAKRRVG